MNQQLAPREPFTKEECLQQFQNLRSQKGIRISATSTREASATVSVEEKSANGLVKVNELWTNEQQRQLEAGLSRYPASLGMSQSERWKAIAELVEVLIDHRLSF
jgi:hypothetical protein